MRPEDDLDPALSPRSLSADELLARTRGRAADAALEPLIRPRVAAHVSACRQALDVIENELDQLVETLDLDPTASTRAAALWLLVGRCVGQQRAVLLLAEHGMAVEGRPLDRSVKEMSNVVQAIAAEGPVAEKLARKWLSDGDAYVKAQAGRQGMAVQFSDPAREEAVFAAHGVRSLKEADKRNYEYLSRAAHGRRSSMLESYYVETRHMARGGRYAFLDIATAVIWASGTTANVVLAAGIMLLPFRGQKYVEERILCLHEAIEVIRNDQVLDPEAVAAEVGLGRYPFWPAA